MAPNKVPSSKGEDISRLPARSLLLSCWLRGVHWTPATFQG